MRQARTGSASVEVESTSVCGFFTSWGDGAFPVYRDVSADGALLRFRVELSAPEIVTRHRRFEELWFGELSKLAIATPAVMSGGQIRRLERDAPRKSNDSGWCVYTGTETDEDLDRPGAATLVPLRDLIKRQPDLEPILNAAPPSAFELAEDGSWRPIPPPPARDEVAQSTADHSRQAVAPVATMGG